MILERVERLTVFYEPEAGRRIRVGRLGLKQRQILFEFDPAFGLELSPFKLPRRPGVVVGDSNVLEGLMGVFDDSLPDGWGQLLIERRATELGTSALSLTPLDRLALVGSRAMGALVYEPERAVQEPAVVKLSELAEQAQTVLRGAEGVDLEPLIAIGGSPKGARPKALIQLAPNGDVHFGARNIEPGFTAWIVKFRSSTDDLHAGPLEHAYFLMAKAAGIEVPRTRLLGRTKRNPGYFAIERFDRDGRARIHSHTLGGLLHLPRGYPALDYRDLLKVTRTLTRNESAVTEMFRRACFNALAHNRDDHSRNFAFLMDESGAWRPSPAYDLTFSMGPGGEHTMLIAGEGRKPGASHLAALAAQAGVKHGAKILRGVQEAIGDFGAFATDAGVPARLRKATAAAL